MKQILTIVLCVLLGYGCIGCSQQQVTDTPATSTGTVQTMPAFGDPDQQKQMAAVSVPIKTESQTANDGTVIFNYTCQDISLILPEPEVADKIVIDFLNRIDTFEQNKETILSAAKEAHATGRLITPYLCRVAYSPTRIDYNVLSMHVEYIAYSGASHPETTYQSVTYDLTTGDVLALSDIIAGPDQFDELCQSVIRILDDSKEDLQLYDGFDKIVKNLFKSGPQNVDFWYFSANGLCFYFSPYETAPYASGVVTAEIPYGQLVGILDDAYFPPEHASALGDIKIADFNDETVIHFNQFAELGSSESDKKFLIYADKPIYNVYLETVNSTENHVVFAAYALTPGDAIAIANDYAQNYSKIKISYVSENETKTQYITVKNDTPALSEP